MKPRSNPVESAAPLALALVLLLGACHRSDDAPLLGTLEWDRISLPAEASERVQALHVAEGAQVAKGELLVTLDNARMQARLQQGQAQLAQQQARLDELRHGSRREDLDAARAALVRAQAGLVEADKQFARQSELAAKQLVARAALDSARATRDRNAAEVAQAQAQLRELTAGTREEQVAQAEAAVRTAQAALDELRVSATHLELRAPRDGRIDALPFKPGDQPPLGASLASELVGDAPYARVFVPASRRAALRPGQKFLLHVEGVDHDLHAHLRSIASEPAFTPYYALTGDDASRLVYRAELVVDDGSAASLPAGLPVQARALP